MKVKRITLSGTAQTIDFNVEHVAKWLVKNLTDGDIFAYFDENTPENEKIKIPSGYGQVIVHNENWEDISHLYGSKIIVSGTGEVEIQALCYTL